MKIKAAVRMGLLTVIVFVGFSCEKDLTSSKIGPLYEIEVMPSALNVEIDSTAQFIAVGKDMNGNDISGLSFTWETAQIGIATIDNEGVVTGVAPGITTVTAKLREVKSLPAEVSVMEATTGTVTDIDGNVYRTVKIGDQWWLAENLKVTHFRNGEAIAHVTDAAEWYSQTTSAYCVYDNDAGNESHTYGYLYNWYTTIDNREIAPDGWHVPTDDEWKQLEMFLGMSQSEADGTNFRGTDEGNKLKFTSGWYAEGSGTDNYGFAALPGGYRGFAGTFYNMGSYAYLWSATQSHRDSSVDRTLSYDSPSVYRSNGGKRYGFSLRLVRD